MNKAQRIEDLIHSLAVLAERFQFTFSQYTGGTPEVMREVFQKQSEAELSRNETRISSTLEKSSK